MKNLEVIILAAGKGVRMKSDIPKVLHKICGVPMLGLILDKVEELFPDKIHLVVGYKSEKIKQFINLKYNNSIKDGKINFIVQKKQLGTGDAVKCAKTYFKKSNKNILILCGDTPLIKTSTLNKLIETHYLKKNDITILATIMKNPSGYGRIIKINGKVKEIKEELDLNKHEKNIKYINSGIYCLNSKTLFEDINLIKKNPNKGEYYFTDIVKIMSEKNRKIGLIITKNSFEVKGVNTKKELKDIEKQLTKKRIL